ncbi:hypothetical protein AVEN_51798-1 [Araneus ventricosus]|uniref:Uncharacterized protein n=1 Tax=Araneus ventricosus TaxID=182803 RepID=A0A4Y2WU67_ARAVE|nr:hypothetical protein AVEN_51798-1 [Araneus ventricosus]
MREVKTSCRWSDAEGRTAANGACCTLTHTEWRTKRQSSLVLMRKEEPLCMGPAVTLNDKPEEVAKSSRWSDVEGRTSVARPVAR